MFYPNGKLTKIETFKGDTWKVVEKQRTFGLFL